MTVPTAGTIHSDFLLSEAKGYRSRKSIIIAAAATLIKAGTVLQAAARSSATVSPKAGGNVGNGVFGAVTVTGPSTPGLYRVVLTGSGATAAFNVIDPNGNVVAAGAVASAFSAGGLAFTLADGATDFVAGDSFIVNVNVGESTYAPYTSGTVAGVLYNDIPANAATPEMQAVAMVRDCEVKRSSLIGLTAAAETALEALGIIVCGVYTN